MLRAWLLAVLATSCSYRPSFRDCDVSCASPSDCPDNFTCGPEGLCRAAGASLTCSAVRDARDAEDAMLAGDAGRDAPPIDAPPIDAPLGPPKYYGCFAVGDGAYNCTETCASQSRTCSTACNGNVWYAYSLSGPCNASQPTSFSGNTCSQKAVIGTGDTIYVQCCCQ